ncbi:uncharacterized protein LOC142339954 [Convolutriloba macropyga]|uniref:uncharacterized protein LOC142339954 n=1 Tax=Convolutriloba macropyga TaxID=536237 RepID=UPI003F5260C1
MTKKQMRKKRKFLIIATAFLFLAFVAACLSHVPMMITASWPNGYVCWVSGLHVPKWRTQTIFRLQKVVLRQEHTSAIRCEEIQDDQHIGRCHIVFRSYSCPSAGYIHPFAYYEMFEDEKEERKILNLCGAICTVVLLTTGCILVTVSMAPSTIPKSTLYTKVAALSVMGAASKAVNGQGGSTTVNWAFFMPWCALLFSLVATLMLLLILVMKAPLKKRRRRRTGRPKKGKK